MELLRVFVILLSVIFSVAPQAPPNSEDCPGIKNRLDCQPEAEANEEVCRSRGCCWGSADSPDPKAPRCFFPKNYGGYRTVNITDVESGFFVELERTFPSPYPRDVPHLAVNVEYLSDAIVRVKISDRDSARYESIYPKIQKPAIGPVNPQYEVKFDANRTGFQVSRLNGAVLFDALNVAGSLIFADQFLEISTIINGRIYGIGEHRSNLTIEPGWKRFTMFNHDVPPAEDTNLYGAHPFYLVVEPDGTSHGVFLQNSNAMDVIVTPQPAITFRPIGGILDFYFFLGPTPASVIQQYTSIVGRTILPPYWGLGFHLCKYGYPSAEYTREVWLRNRDLKIPFDVQWNDYDYMIDHNGFTLNNDSYKNLPAFIEEVHAAGMRYIPIVDPGFSASEPPGSYPPFDIGKELGVMIKAKDGSVFTGLVWNTNTTAWPDFTHPNIEQFWGEMVTNFSQLVDFDGLWIDMNEPSNFLNGSRDGCPDDELENPPYMTGVQGGKLSYMTVCMNAQQFAGPHYNVHNLFGIAESEVTNNILRKLGKRPFIISRSTFAGSGRYTGHWSGDNEATWYDLTKTVQELLSMNMYGVSLTGADICGFRENTTQELCNRWFQLGSFYTFTRNHNGGVAEQDPWMFDNRTRDSIRKSLTTRYSLLPYLYTLFYHSHVHGDTVARPLFFEYPSDPEAQLVELSFLWGSGLYIIPVVRQGAESVNAYFPPGCWYDLYNYTQMKITLGKYVTLSAPYDTIPLFYRGGNIIPTQRPGVTTTESRENEMTLIVAPDENGEASGSLYWDDGLVIDPVETKSFGFAKYTFKGSVLDAIVEQWNTGEVPKIEAIHFLGVDDVTSASVNGNRATVQTINQTLRVTGFIVRASDNFTVELIRSYSSDIMS